MSALGKASMLWPASSPRNPYSVAAHRPLRHAKPLRQSVPLRTSSAPTPVGAPTHTWCPYAAQDGFSAPDGFSDPKGFSAPDGFSAPPGFSAPSDVSPCKGVCHRAENHATISPTTPRSLYYGSKFFFHGWKEKVPQHELSGTALQTQHKKNHFNDAAIVDSRVVSGAGGRFGTNAFSGNNKCQK